jgi:gamma-glutamylcyclotransferase
MVSLTADNLMRLDEMDTDEASGYEFMRDKSEDSGSSARFDSEEERQDRLITPRELEEIESLEDRLRNATTMEETREVVAVLSDKKHLRVKPTTSDEGVEEESGPLMWYFAYGSNMNVAQLLTRIGAFEDKKLLHLPDYRLAFNKRVSLKPRHQLNTRGTDPTKLGFANVIPVPGDKVYGIAYLVRETQVQKMDVYEGVANGHYTRTTMSCFDDSSAPYSCEVYIACPAATADNLLPTEGYMSHLLGGRGLLPKAYVDLLEAQPRVKK